MAFGMTMAGACAIPEDLLNLVEDELTPYHTPIDIQ